MFADSVQAPEPAHHGIFSTAYNYAASGCAAVVNFIGTMILMNEVSEPGFGNMIHRGRVTVAFAKSMGDAEPDSILGKTGVERRQALQAHFRGMMKCAGLRDDQIIADSENPDQAILINPTNNALQVAKYEASVARLSPAPWSL